MNKIWIVTAVDYGESCDGKARVLLATSSEEEAKAFVHSDIEEWIDKNAGECVECDFSKMCAWFIDNEDARCEWNVEQVSVDL